VFQNVTGKHQRQREAQIFLAICFGGAPRACPAPDIAPAERSVADLFRAVKGATSVVAAGPRPAFWLDNVFLEVISKVAFHEKSIVL
jgi:hypothetical protein